MLVRGNSCFFFGRSVNDFPFRFLALHGFVGVIPLLKIPQVSFPKRQASALRHRAMINGPVCTLPSHPLRCEGVSRALETTGRKWSGRIQAEKSNG